MSQIKTARTSGVAPHIPVIEPLSISENGTYTAPEGVDGYSPVTVDVPNTYTASDEGKVVSSGALVAQTTRTVTENGTYDTTTNNSVVVDVQEQPWEPLEDGYSNFWFELTDDTLSPWLNFSAKKADATIDWGDGSGEVALDTLTPTHTYAKAGKYVVKVKGVTGVGYQSVLNTAYTHVLQYIEFNDEVTEIRATPTYPSGFYGCVKLKAVAGLNHITTVTNTYNNFMCTALGEAEINMPDTSSYMFAYVNTLQKITFGNTVANIRQRTCLACVTLNNVVIPSSVTEIGTYAFQGCVSLSEIHCQPTTPPTLGTNVFNALPPNFVIYVPVGTGDTYKAAAGWSAYADHIVEEGQTLSKAALRRIQETEKNEGDDVR